MSDGEDDPFERLGDVERDGDPFERLDDADEPGETVTADDEAAVEQPRSLTDRSEVRERARPPRERRRKHRCKENTADSDRHRNRARETRQPTMGSVLVDRGERSRHGPCVARATDSPSGRDPNGGLIVPARLDSAVRVTVR